MAIKTNDRYTEAVGRRKTSTARARLVAAPKQHVTVNGKALEEYFATEAQRAHVLEPLGVEGVSGTFAITVTVRGGGMVSQSEAVRHSIARALVTIEPAQRTVLKAHGYLKRDPRMKERRKFGLKKARRAPQWSKR